MGLRGRGVHGRGDGRGGLDRNVCMRDEGSCGESKDTGIRE